MNILDKELNQSAEANAAPRMGEWSTVLHPALILAVSLVTAGVVFLSGAELNAIFESEIAIFKLLAGVALLFFLGMHFTQSLVQRRPRAEVEAAFKHNSIELASMRKALQSRLADRSGARNDTAP